MAVLITNEVSRNPKSEIQTNSWLCSKKRNVNTLGLETLEMYKIEMLSIVLCVLEKSLKVPTSKKKCCTFFSWNLLSIPRYISWHHWKNLLTSKRGHSRASNFSTEFDQIWVKTSGVSRGLIFGPICKCHTILESSWHTDLRFLKLEDLGGH